MHGLLLHIRQRQRLGEFLGPFLGQLILRLLFPGRLLAVGGGTNTRHAHNERRKRNDA